MFIWLLFSELKLISVVTQLFKMTTQTHTKCINLERNDWENAITLAKHKGLLRQLKHEIALFNITCIRRAKT